MTQKNKSLLILLIALIILVAVYFIWQNPLAKKSSQISSEEIYSANLDNLQKIEITKAGQTTSLEKQGDKWVAASQNNSEANAALIDNLTSALKEMKKGQIISQNQEKLAGFDLTEDKATILKLSDNQNRVILEILIGKLGSSYTNTYIKKINSSNVLLVSQNLNSLINRPDWLKPAETEPTNTDSGN